MGNNNRWLNFSSLKIIKTPCLGIHTFSSLLLTTEVHHLFHGITISLTKWPNYRVPAQCLWLCGLHVVTSLSNQLTSEALCHKVNKCTLINIMFGCSSSYTSRLQLTLIHYRSHLSSCLDIVQYYLSYISMEIRMIVGCLLLVLNNVYIITYMSTLFCFM